MTESIDRKDQQARRNLRLALIHVVLALAFLGAFVWHLTSR